MKVFVETVAKALVDHPEDVHVTQIDSVQSVVLELRVHPDDVGMVVGRQGRNIKALRTLVASAAMKTLKKRAMIDVVEDK